MHSQMSGGASAPRAASDVALAPPRIATPAPALVPRKPGPSKKKRVGLILALVAGVIVAERGFHYARERQAAALAAKGGNVVRTAAVTTGSVARTLRLTGTTGAKNYSSLISPRLRGSRGTGGRDGSFRTANSNNSASNFVVQSNAGASGGRSGGSTSSSTTSADGSTTVASTNGQQTGGGSSAFRSATSRVGNSRTSSAPSTARSTTSSPGGTSSSSGGSSSALGSTSGSLQSFGGGGGGNGGGGTGPGGTDFMLVLQSAVKPGVSVKKGDVVAEFDRQNMLNRLDDYRASVAQLQASVRKLEAELKVAKESHTQTIETAKAALDKARLDVKTIPVLGAIDAEKTRLAAEEAEARYKQLLAEVKFVEVGQQSQIRNAELEYQQAMIELRRAEANADRMILKAPISGLVVMQNLFRGTEMAQIQAGDQLYPGMMFMQIVDLSSMVINATVNQADVESLRLGQKAKVRFDAYPDLQVEAHVDAIGAMTRTGGMRASYVKEIPVILRIDTMDPRIIPDLSVSADVVLESEEQATVAPRSAVFRDSPDAAPHVFVKVGDRWERREVEVGVTGNVHAAIRSGLKPGEIVAEDIPPLESNKERG